MKKPQKPHPHRHNSDGSFDSICSVCYRTIASKATEGELLAAEDEHVCSGVPVPPVSLPVPRPRAIVSR